MAHDILIAGALFPDVPSVQFPDSQQVWHSFTDVSDTTAAAADVAQGKQFYDASGVLTQGTASGSSVEVDALSVTANGTYTAPTGHAYSPVTVNVSGGGGASNFVTGEFTGTTTGALTINLPYTGSGYPIMAYVVVSGGAYDPNSTWYNLKSQYAVAMWCMSKSIMSVEPTYTGSGSANQSMYASIYKSSTTNPNSYTRTSGMNTPKTYSSDVSTGSSTNQVVFNSKNTMSVYISSGSFAPSITYEYFIVYSE